MKCWEWEYVIFSILQIFLWDANEWELLKGRSLQRKPDVISDTHIQFDPDQRNFLVVKQCYLALYEAQELTHINQVCYSFVLSYVNNFSTCILWTMTRYTSCFMAVGASISCVYLPGRFLIWWVWDICWFWGWAYHNIGSFKSWSYMQNRPQCLPSPHSKVSSFFHLSE